ncbi:GDSL esterase/lipase [Platanthera guangdongensis]|uniref:GDSL esterase/lipase n=1 Tax=Platanthera guangdongensis TaxID=2320717 RepID=A0ABR2LBV5_9ASPA
MLGQKKCLLLSLLLLFALLPLVSPAPQVPCYFIFGDSLVDNGNNNDIASLARANYLPYGIDFPSGPTGRFSNGLTTVDVIVEIIASFYQNFAAELLGFDDYIPPYANTRGQALLGGANFASAAAGIREETGAQLGGRISFGGQLQNYIQAVQQIVQILGDEDTAANYLSKCIFSVGMGSNDYLNNYFMPVVYSTSRQYTPAQYGDVLIEQYSQQIRTLYDNGARKVAVIGVGQVGCSPNELAQQSSDGVTCVETMNSAIQLFNNRLINLVNQFNNLDGAHFTFINGFGIFQDIISHPAANGLTVTNRGCCGVGRNNGQITCLPEQTPCANRKEYLFWDAFHPTEAGNILIGRRSYRAQSSSDAYPMDLQHLAQI